MCIRRKPLTWITGKPGKGWFGLKPAGFVLANLRCNSAFFNFGVSFFWATVFGLSTTFGLFGGGNVFSRDLIESSGLRSSMLGVTKNSNYFKIGTNSHGTYGWKWKRRILPIFHVYMFHSKYHSKTEKNRKNLEQPELAERAKTERARATDAATTTVSTGFRWAGWFCFRLGHNLSFCLHNNTYIDTHYTLDANILYRILTGFLNVDILHLTSVYSRQSNLVSKLRLQAFKLFVLSAKCNI